MDSTNKRQVAKKVRIKDLVDGKYVKVEGDWEPNYIETKDGNIFSRINILAIVSTDPIEDINSYSFIIDDGTGRVPIRIFGENATKVNLGDPIVVIGRPREFNNQRYIVPEIIKKINNIKWIEHRKLELALLYPNSELSNIEKVEKNIETKEEKTQIISEKTSEIDNKNKKQQFSNINSKINHNQLNNNKIIEKTIKNNQKSDLVDNDEFTDKQNPIDIIIEIIKELDTGNGADIEEVIQETKDPNAEKIIENLLKEGEIFEINSGKLKILD